MINLKIDNKELQAGKDKVLMEVIREAGIEVPSMCYLKDAERFTSCMVCVVKDRKSGKIIPSCSLKAEEGMDIISLDDEIREARKTALELLLSEHVGDCEAPCQVTCPAHMDIPLMNRLLAEGKFAEALKVVKKDIALPAVLGRICPAPCEGACRRKSIDEAVSICLLKRFAGDEDLESAKSWMPEKATDSGKKVTVIGAGPAGLAAAYYLVLKGHSCELIDRNTIPGGSLVKEVDEKELPPGVLQKEIGLIVDAGVNITGDTQVDGPKFKAILSASDAVVVASGKGQSGSSEWGLPMHERGILADNKTYRVGDTGVFAIGSALKPTKLAIRVLGQGKEVACSVDQYLRGEAVTGEKGMFNSRFAKLQPVEYAEYLKESVEGNRLEPEKRELGLSAKQVMEEARRCLHCDCRDMHHCKLRIYADSYGADQKRFKSDERLMCTKQDQHELIIYEPSKCIKCGICVRITEKYKDDFGLTFIGRGFEVVVGVPFNETIGAGLKQAALEVADACPTGAISRKSKVNSV